MIWGMLGILAVSGLFLTLFERDFVFAVGIKSNIFFIVLSLVHSVNAYDHNMCFMRREWQQCSKLF